MLSKIDYILICSLLLASSLLGCTAVPQAEPVAAAAEGRLTELSGCQGLNEAGQPRAVANSFSPYVKRLVICGHLETEQPVTVAIRWYYDDELIGQQVEKNMPAGYFTSFLPAETGKTFPEGSYRVEARAEGLAGQHLELIVEQL